MTSKLDADPTFTQLLLDAKKGDKTAMQCIWEGYFDKLVGLARVRLRDTPKNVADEEDVAIHAMQAFFAGVRKNRFRSLCNHRDLWRLLAQVTVRTASNQRDAATAQKRGGGHMCREAAIVTERTHEVFNRCDELLDELDDDDLRFIAKRKAEGYKNAEVAIELKCTERTIERKLVRIRSIWKPYSRGKCTA